MRTLDETDRLLDLLREAGSEPVTLDELAVVGLRDPAQALAALELAGHHVARMHDRRADGRVACVRLCPDSEDRAASSSPAPLRRHARPALALALLVLALLLAVSARR